MAVWPLSYIARYSSATIKVSENRSPSDHTTVYGENKKSMNYEKQRLRFEKSKRVDSAWPSEYTDGKCNTF